MKPKGTSKRRTGVQTKKERELKKKKKAEGHARADIFQVVGGVKHDRALEKKEQLRRRRKQ